MSETNEMLRSYILRTYGLALAIAEPSAEYNRAYALCGILSRECGLSRDEVIISIMFEATQQRRAA